MTLRFKSIKEVWSILRLAREINPINSKNGKEKVRYWINRLKIKPSRLGTEMILSESQVKKLRENIDRFGKVVGCGK